MCVGINKQTGAIIGSVERVGCSINHPSIWAEKTDTDNKGYYENPIYNWVLDYYVYNKSDNQ